MRIGHPQKERPYAQEIVVASLPRFVAETRQEMPAMNKHNASRTTVAAFRRATARVSLLLAVAACLVAVTITACRLRDAGEARPASPVAPAAIAALETGTVQHDTSGGERMPGGGGAVLRPMERTAPQDGLAAGPARRPPLFSSADDLLMRGESLATTEMPPDADGVRRVVRLVRAGESKYPVLRVEETLTREAGGERRKHISVMAADHVVVKVRHGAEELLRRDALRIPGVASVRKLYPRRLFLVSAATPDTETVPTLLASLAASRAVEYAEPDHVAFLRVMPNDPSFNTKWGLHNTGQSGGTVDADMDAPEAWDISTGSSNVILAVADSGVMTDHEDLAANIWQNPGETGLDSHGRDKRTNGLDDDGNGLDDDVVGWDFANNDNTPDDLLGHGTHVAGIVGAVGNNGKGIAGVCWNVRIIAMTIGELTFHSDAASAVTYAADHGARAFNASWGGPDYSQALYDAIRYAGTNGLGMVVSCASGNDSIDVDPVDDYPMGYDLDNIIGVASTDRNDGLSSFSNYGATKVDVGAPGSDINSTMNTGGYETQDGTSMAAPQVTGACGLLLSLNPSLTAVQLKQRLVETVDPLSSLRGKCVSGGRVNVHKACQGMGAAVIRLREHTVADADDPPYAGNGDGYANPGESIGLNMTVESIGFLGVTGLTATVRLKHADTSFSIPVATAGLGDLAGSSSLSTGPVCRIEVHTPVTMPHTGNFEVVFSASAPAGVTWTADVPVVVNAPASVAGRVTRIATGEGIAGATVAYAGPVSGSVSTDANGYYAAAVVAGTYSLNASAMGLVDSAVERVTVPPDRSDVDFAVGAVTLAAEGPDGAVLLYPREKRIIPLRIVNRGDAPVALTYSLNVDGRVPLRTAGGADRLFSLDGLFPCTLSERNPSTGAILYTVTLSGEGFFMHLCFDGDYVYVLRFGGMGGFYLHKRDPDTGAAVGSPLALPGTVQGVTELAADEEGPVLFDGSGVGHRINPSTGALTRIYEFASIPLSSLAFAPGRDAFFSLEDGQTTTSLRERRLADLQVVRTIPTADSKDPVSVAYLGDSDATAVLFVDPFLSAPSTVRFYDPDTGTESGQFAGDNETLDICGSSPSGPRWLSASNLTGSVAAGGVTNIPLYADVTELGLGTHTGRVEITSNDPTNSPLSIEVPVRIVEVAGYAAWRTHHFGSAPAPGDGYGDDPEGDGEPNLLEFLLNGSPSAAGALLRPGGSDGGEFLCELTWRKGTVDSLLQLRIRHSLLHGNWDTITQGSGYTLRSRTDVGADYERVTLGIPSPQPALFVRPVAVP